MISEYSNSQCESRDVPRSGILWLQSITIVWMVVECGVSLLAAARAHSPAMFAFGSDSPIELFSAAIVLLHFSEKRAAKAAAIPLFALALSLALDIQPESSTLGIGLTVIALVIMPVLGWLKRREARRLNNAALAAVRRVPAISRCRPRP
ncbi:MAG: hypothetical protein ACR2I2_09690 [Bryobacteraceae bacterium]